MPTFLGSTSLLFLVGTISHVCFLISKKTSAAYDQAVHHKSPLLQRAQEDIGHVMSVLLETRKITKQEANHYASIKFMPEPSKCGISHYYRLCLELACQKNASVFVV